MAPLAERPQPASSELALHNFPNHIPDSLLPEFVPANYIEASNKLRSAWKYISKQFSYELPRAAAQTNVDTQCALIQLSELVLGEGEAERRQFSGNLIESLTETVEKCETRGER